MGCKIKCTFYNLTVTEPLNVGILMRDLQLGPYSPKEWASMIRGNPNSATKMMIPAYKQCTVSMYRSMGTLIGNPLQYAADSLYSALTNQNPNRTMFGYVFASTSKPNDASPFPPAGKVWTKVELTYYVKFFEYKYQTSSGTEVPAIGIPADAAM